MDPSTRAALRRINRSFYASHADDFHRTRHAGGWPGWTQVVERAAQAGRGALRVLDLGCGNGRFALFLDRRADLLGGRAFDYLGLDLSPELIARAEAAARQAAGRGPIRFLVGDMEAPGLEGSAPGMGAESEPEVHAEPEPQPVKLFDLVALFGVLHHIPGFAARRRVLERAASAAAPGGVLALTCWQFVDDPRFAQRRLDWRRDAGLDPEHREPGDHLLRWGPPGSGAVRYCHHVDEAELDRLVTDLPLAELDRYRADGPGGAQNLYWLGIRPAPGA